MPKLTPEDRTRIKAAHPDATLMRTSAAPEHDFVFRQATLAEFDAFMSAINSQDSTTKLYAHRRLAADLLVHPGEAEWEAFARQKPGVAHTLGHELSQRAGLNAEILVDAL